MSENCDVRFTSSSLKIPLSPPSLFSRTLGSRLTEATKSLFHLVNSFRTCSKPLNSFARRSPLLCSASLSLSLPAESTQLEVAAAQPKGQSYARHTREDEERVLISEVLVRNKDGEELERKDLEAEAVAALKACRPNSALTVREVQEDVHRIIDSGLFCSCMPVAVDTRDGIRLVFQVCLGGIVFLWLNSEVLTDVEECEQNLKH